MNFRENLWWYFKSESDCRPTSSIFWVLVVPTEFQAEVSLILCYLDINCSQPKLTFECNWFCVSLEKSPERNALYFLYLLHRKKGGDAACTRVLHRFTCAGYQQFQSMGTFTTRVVWCLYYYKSHLNLHTFDSWMCMPFTEVSEGMFCMISTPVMLNSKKKSTFA